MASNLVRGFMLPALVIVAAGAAGAWFLARSGSKPVVPEVSPPAVGADPDAAARSGDRAGDETKPETPFAIVFGGGLDGRIWAPPCAVVSTGGIARIGPMVLEAAQGVPAAVVVDTGDMVGGTGDTAAIALRETFIALSESGVAVSAVGEKDLLLGLERWRAVKNSHAMGISVICANLEDDEGRALLPPVAMAMVGGRRIAFVAVLSLLHESTLREAGVAVRLTHPAEAVRKALAAVQERDGVVLIAHTGMEEAKALHTELTDIDLTLVAHGGPLPSLEPELVDGRPVLVAGREWRYASRLVFGARRDGALELLDHMTRSVVELEGGNPAHALHADFYRKEARGKGMLEEALGEEEARWPAGTPRYAGEDSCAKCHGEAHGDWDKKADPHGASVAVLDRGELRRTPMSRVRQCLSCHATGVGRPGGFRAPGGPLSSVSCEACHGPGAEHVATEGRSALADARASCVTCHTREMSPGFDVDKALEALAAGR